MSDFLSDETIREMLDEATLREDSLMMAICRAALFGCLDARKQLSTIFGIYRRAEQLGADIDVALRELDPADLAMLRQAAINHFETN